MPGSKGRKFYLWGRHARKIIQETVRVADLWCVWKIMCAWLAWAVEPPSPARAHELNEGENIHRYCSNNYISEVVSSGVCVCVWEKGLGQEMKAQDGYSMYMFLMEKRKRNSELSAKIFVKKCQLQQISGRHRQTQENAMVEKRKQQESAYHTRHTWISSDERWRYNVIT